MNRARWFAIVVALQVLFLLGWAAYHERERASATVVLLETVPVDPRDLLRGDYMILGYKIGRVPAPAGPGTKESHVFPMNPMPLGGSVTSESMESAGRVASTSMSARTRRG